MDNKVKTRKMPRIIHEDAKDLIAGDAIIWGTIPKYKRTAAGWEFSRMRDQWIGRFLRHPDGSETIWWYCDDYDTAVKLFVHAILTHRRDLIERISACTSMGFGLQEDWMKQPVIFIAPPGVEKTTKPWCWVMNYDYEDADGNESDRRGPYGLTYKEPEQDDGPYIWLQGRRVNVGEVSDMQVDTTLDENTLTYVEKLAMLNERKAWQEAYLAGDFDAYNE